MIILELWPEALREPVVKNFGWKRHVRRIAEGAYIRAYMFFRGLEAGRGAGVALATCMACV
jgi:hypothetical protein